MGFKSGAFKLLREVVAFCIACHRRSTKCECPSMTPRRVALECGHDAPGGTVGKFVHCAACGEIPHWNASHGEADLAD